MTASDYPESLVLGPLEALNGGGGGVREPNRCSIVYGGSEVGLPDGDEGFFGAAPRRASQGAKKTSLLLNCCYCPVDMGGEGEVGVEGDAEELRAAGKRERGVKDGDERSFLGFVGVGSEEGDEGFRGGDG